MTARNPNTGSQVTRYVYGTTTTESGVARSTLRVPPVPGAPHPPQTTRSRSTGLSRILPVPWSLAFS